MKIDYNICWVEDKIDSKPFISLTQSIRNHLENEFFNVNIKTAEDFEDFRNIYETYDSFDLIITDLNLNESHGSQVINFVRDIKHIMTEIFFYSANSQLSDINLINSNRITFYQMDDASSYRELGTSIIDLIDLTILKFQNIIAMRGMIMHETSSLDLRMATIVRSQLSNPKLKDKLEPALNKITENILANASEKFKKANSRKVKDIFKDNVLFNSSQKIFALGEILKILNENNFSEDYFNEIISIRNQFAHSELQKDKSGYEYFKVKDQEIKFDGNFCKKIRKNIKKHSDNISNIENKPL